MLRSGTLVLTAMLVAVLGVAAVAAYRVLESEIATDIYRVRLAELEQDYSFLRSQYNQVVRKTAVTELQVRDGLLSVGIRTVDGVTRTLPTPFDPGKEIYVDYVVLQGRLWIRRIFDQATPPDAGMLIDPELADVDWQSEGASVGKAAYRELSEGRWIVTVTGDGSLGLTRRPDEESLELAAPPVVRDYAPVDEQVQTALRELSAEEILRTLARRLGITG
jgi:hypothetical protein